MAMARKEQDAVVLGLDLGRRLGAFIAALGNAAVEEMEFAAGEALRLVVEIEDVADGAFERVGRAIVVVPPEVMAVIVGGELALDIADREIAEPEGGAELRHQ